ncbi:ATP-binding protein [Bacillus gobiensis]|uniref:ATP-binding protein n=1 Tax=Bacillus gobiensis TaxID=1441095 RepID=UPI003D1F5AE4
MKSFREALKKRASTNTDSKITNQYKCPGCGEIVKEFTTVIAMGPSKGKTVSSTIGCNCSVYEKVKEEQKEADQARMKRIFKDYSLVNKSLEQANFKTFDQSKFPDAFKTAVDFVKEFDLKQPSNLFFQGSFGTGKSHLSISISKSLVSRGYSSIFISIPKLLTKIRGTYNKDSVVTEDQLIKALYAADLVVFDDIGAEGDLTGWSAQKLFELLDQRSGKHNVFTTNLQSDDFEATRDRARLFSRIMENTTPIIMNGSDYRKRHFLKEGKESV